MGSDGFSLCVLDFMGLCGLLVSECWLQGCLLLRELPTGAVETIVETIVRVGVQVWVYGCTSCYNVLFLHICFKFWRHKAFRFQQTFPLRVSNKIHGDVRSFTSLLLKSHKCIESIVVRRNPSWKSIETLLLSGTVHQELLQRYKWSLLQRQYHGTKDAWHCCPKCCEFAKSHCKVSFALLTTLNPFVRKKIMHHQTGGCYPSRTFPPPEQLFVWKRPVQHCAGDFWCKAADRIRVRRKLADVRSNVQQYFRFLSQFYSQWCSDGCWLCKRIELFVTA